MNQKQIIRISAIVIVIIAIIASFWIFRSDEIVPGMGDPSGGGTFPSGGQVDIEGRPIGSDGEIIDVPVDISPTDRSSNQLTFSAISGAGVSSSTVRYIEKSTGHIYEIGFDGQNRRRISNTTILRTFDSFWSPEADKIAIRYFEEGVTYPLLKTFLVEIGDEEISEEKIEGNLLPQSATGIIVSPEEDKVFYFDSGTDTTIGIIADFKNQGKKTLLVTPFSDFTADWFSRNFISLLTKPSALVKGNLYFIDVRNGKLEKIIDGVEGLTVLASPLGDKVIYGVSQGKGQTFETKIFNTADGSSNYFGLRTLPEKCVWGVKDKDIVYCASPNSLPSGIYPDEWYQGIVSFSDSIWKINVVSGKAEVLFEKTNADAINLSLDEKESHLFYTNKKDGTLWVINL